MTKPGRVSVRSLTEDDDLGALTEGDPLAWQADWWQDMEQKTGIAAHWFVACLDDKPVGYAAGLPLAVGVGGTAHAIMNVVPRARRRGVGAALKAAVEDALRGQFPGVVFGYDDKAEDAIAVAAAWSLEEVGRHHESVLDLQKIDREAFAAKAAAPGVELRHLPPLADIDDAQWAELHAYVQERFLEAPDSADGGGELRFEVFRVQITEPWMLFEAIEDGVRLGVTFVMRHPEKHESVNTFFTGVNPEARGRGIAIALKSAQALHMAELGVPSIYTQNMVGNEPILAANRTMGFVRDSGYVDVLVPL